MKVVKINRNPSMSDALDVIDALRKDVEAGKLVAFFVAGMDESDVTISYASSVRHVSRLRLQGAMQQALHEMMEGRV